MSISSSETIHQVGVRVEDDDASRPQSLEFNIDLAPLVMFDTDECLGLLAFMARAALGGDGSRQNGERIWTRDNGSADEFEVGTKYILSPC